MMVSLCCKVFSKQTRKIKITGADIYWQDSLKNSLVNPFIG